jgi:hypothetical protein
VLPLSLMNLVDVTVPTFSLVLAPLYNPINTLYSTPYIEHKKIN